MKIHQYAVLIGCTLVLTAQETIAHVQAVSVPATKPAAMGQNPPDDPDDTPEEIAEDAARDLKDSSFFNKPKASRQDFNEDWQTCRLIARGSRTPGGVYVQSYNPAVISPWVAGVAAGIGGAIGQAIVIGKTRRLNRTRCLMYKGWRKVEVSRARAVEIGAMNDAERDAYFNTIVGAETVEGEVTEIKTFHLEPDAALNLDAPLPGPATLVVAQNGADPKAPIVPEPGQGLLVLAFARPDAASAGRSARLNLYRYDIGKRDLIFRPKEWKKWGDYTTYYEVISSKNKNASYEIHVIKLTAGTYAIGSALAGKSDVQITNCFGAPVVTVPEGKTIYIGDWFPFMDVTLSNGQKLPSAMGWKQNLERARTQFSQFQPQLAQSMENAEIRNGATYGCAAVIMNNWELPGVPSLEDPVTAATQASPEAGPSPNTSDRAAAPVQPIS